jgi:hypothetical protein
MKKNFIIINVKVIKIGSLKLLVRINDLENLTKSGCIASYQVVKNPWYYGWGIRLTPHGWLYNVSGSYAVEIKMKTGKKYRIGTNVPNDFEKAICSATIIFPG